MDDDETYGPAYISTDQMEEVERVKSLQTAKDAGDLSYFSLAAGRPSRHMDPVHHHRERPPARPRTSCDSHEGEEWLYGMEGEIEIEYGNETSRARPRRVHLLRFHRAPPGARPQWAKR